MYTYMSLSTEFGVSKFRRIDILDGVWHGGGIKGWGHKAFCDRANQKQKKKKKKKKEKWDLHISPGRYWFSVVSDYCARHRTINVLAPSRNVLTRFNSYCLHRSALLIFHFPLFSPLPPSFSVHFVYVSFRTDIYIDKD